MVLWKMGDLRGDGLVVVSRDGNVDKFGKYKERFFGGILCPAAFEAAGWDGGEEVPKEKVRAGLVGGVAR